MHRLLVESKQILEINLEQLNSWLNTAAEAQLRITNMTQFKTKALGRRCFVVCYGAITIK